jgi:hypothetical protein
MALSDLLKDKIADLTKSFPKLLTMGDMPVIQDAVSEIIDITIQEAGGGGGGGGNHMVSDVVDAFDALAFSMTTDNLLETEGSRVLSVRNGGIEHLNVRRGDDFWGDTNIPIFELCDENGAPMFQITTDTNYDTQILYKGNDIEDLMMSDWSYAPGYNMVEFYRTVDTTPAFYISAIQDGVDSMIVDIVGGATPYFRAGALGASWKFYGDEAKIEWAAGAHSGAIPRWRGTSSGAPAGDDHEGDLYYDSGDTKVYIYANSAWAALN